MKVLYPGLSLLIEINPVKLCVWCEALSPTRVFVAISEAVG